MNGVTFQKTRHATWNREPVVVVPVSEWERITDALEDVELYRSRGLRADVAKARAEVRAGKTYTLDEVEHRIRLH